jgi:hypothetical protein
VLTLGANSFNLNELHPQRGLALHTSFLNSFAITDMLDPAGVLISPHDLYAAKM